MRREEESRKEEDKLRRKEEERAKRDAILEQHRLKKEMERMAEQVGISRIDVQDGSKSLWRLFELSLSLLYS